MDECVPSGLLYSGLVLIYSKSQRLKNTIGIIKWPLPGRTSFQMYNTLCVKDQEADKLIVDVSNLNLSSNVKHLRSTNNMKPLVVFMRWGWCYLAMSARSATTSYLMMMLTSIIWPSFSLSWVMSTSMGGRVKLMRPWLSDVDTCVKFLVVWRVMKLNRHRLPRSCRAVGFLCF